MFTKDYLIIIFVMQVAFRCFLLELASGVGAKYSQMYVHYNRHFTLKPEFIQFYDNILDIQPRFPTFL